MADRLVGHHALSFSIYFYLYIGGDGVSLVIYMNIHADFCDAKSHQLLPCQRSGPLTRVSIIHMFNNCYYSVDQHHTQRQTDRLKKLRIQKMGNLFCPLFVVRAKPAARHRSPPCIRANRLGYSAKPHLAVKQIAQSKE